MKRVLLVGEGNFSFAASLVKKKKYFITATCLNSIDKICSKLKLENMTYIRNHGGIIYLNVDATQIHNHPDISKQEFDIIIFNFPHVPGKMKIGKNRELVKNFFWSAEKQLAYEGEIQVSLCRGQSGTPIDENLRKWNDTWQIVDLAAHSNLILRNLKAFTTEDNISYLSSGFRGKDKSFDIKGAMTFIFHRGTIMNPEFQLTEDLSMLAQLQLSFAEDLQELKEIEDNKNHPLSVVIDELQTIHHNKLKSLTSYPLFCNEHNQHILFCCETIINNFWRNCCKISIFKTFINDAIPKLEENSLFSFIITCLPCTAIADYFPTFNPYFVSFSKDYVEVFSVLKSILIKFGQIIFDDNIFLNILTDNLDSLNNTTCETFCDLVSNVCHTEHTQIFALFEENIFDGYLIYDNITFICDNDFATKKLNIGQCSGISYNNNTYFYIILDLSALTMLAFNVSQRRVLYDKHSYYIDVACNGSLRKIFRPLALYSSFYIHDTSFWINPDFSELQFLLLIKKLLKKIVSSVKKLDTYYDVNTNKKSLCYRLIYHTLYHPLSREQANSIHIKFRDLLKKKLNVELR